MNNFIDRDDIGLTNFEIFMCNGDYKAALKMLLNKIEKAPVADVATVKHGSWICEEQWKRKSVYKCSECNNFFTIRDDTLNGGRGNMNYCPNCGTKMDLPDKIYEANGWWYE